MKNDIEFLRNAVRLGDFDNQVCFSLLAVLDAIEAADELAEVVLLKTSGIRDSRKMADLARGYLESRREKREG